MTISKPLISFCFKGFSSLEWIGRGKYLLREQAMGISGFTLPTMYRWIRSNRGREMTLHPFRKGHYPGSGQPYMVMAEAGLDGKSQFKGIMKYLEA